MSAPRSGRPVTAAYLERAALHYLERYGASAEMLRRVLARRVAARCRLRGEDAEPFAGLVEETVARARAAGLVDDAAFAAARTATLRRRGGSSRRIAQALSAKGVERELVSTILEGDDAGTQEQAAAAVYARRRRLGPHRREGRSDHRERDLAAMARAGFGYATARAVIDAEAAPDP